MPDLKVPIYLFTYFSLIYDQFLYLLEYRDNVKLLNGSDENLTVHVPLAVPTVIVCETYRNAFYPSFYWTNIPDSNTTTNCKSTATGYDCSSFLYFIATVELNNTDVQCYLRDIDLRRFSSIRSRTIIVEGNILHCHHGHHVLKVSNWVFLCVFQINTNLFFQKCNILSWPYLHKV